MKANCRIVLLDIATQQNEDTGEREKTIVSKSTILGQKGLVGTQTFWSATANNIKLSCTFEVRRNSYKNQKYVYAEGEVYEIVSTSKGTHENEIKLNSALSTDKESKEMILSAMGVM